MTVDNLYDIVNLWYILRYIWIDNLALCLTLIDSLLHNARAYSSHLWTVVRIDDGCYDVTTKGRANLIEQVLITLTSFLIFVVTNLKLSTIGSKTTCQG